MSDSEERYKLACKQALEAGHVRAKLSRRGAVVSGWPSRWPCQGSAPRPTRGKITHASIRSLIRGGWQIANSPTDWTLMTTLTFQGRVENAKEVFRDFCSRLVARNVLGAEWGWVQEYQERKVVHYHLIHTERALTTAICTGPTRWRVVRRKGRPVSVLAGLAGEYLAEEWMDCLPYVTPEIVRFNTGGICEQIAKPELAGWYLGRYASKMSQKQLPEGEPPNGRWWWLSPAARPIMGEEVIVDYWPFERPHKLLFDARHIDPLLDRARLREVPR